MDNGLSPTLRLVAELAERLGQEVDVAYRFWNRIGAQGAQLEGTGQRVSPSAIEHIGGQHEAHFRRIVNLNLVFAHLLIYEAQRTGVALPDYEKTAPSDWVQDSFYPVFREALESQP